MATHLAVNQGFGVRVLAGELEFAPGSRTLGTTVIANIRRNEQPQTLTAVWRNGYALGCNPWHTSSILVAAFRK